MTNVNNPFDGIYQQLNEIKALLSNQDAKSVAPTKNPVLVTRKQAMEILNIRTTTLWLLTRDGVLKSYKIGNRVMYKYAELIEAIDSMAA